MDADLDTLATALYVTVDDLLKHAPQLAPWRPRVGIPPKLSDAELVTLAMMQALLGFTSKARWLRHAGRHLRHLFPYLPGQSGYNKRLRRAAALIRHTIRAVACDTGALARMSDVAEAPGVVQRFPVIAQALLLGASAQLRNMASMGGNLLQGVRCSYFRDPTVAACNKREPGSGCAALDGFNRGHAILGTSEHCIAMHPSDLAVALVALDAVVHTSGPSGERAIPIDEFFLLPGDTPQREHPLEHGELVVAIEVPAVPLARRSLYLKVRDRESYEFALASVAVALRVDDGAVGEVRLALGGVATKPWRARRAERLLVGEPATWESFARSAAGGARPGDAAGHERVQGRAAQRAMVRALETAATMGDGA